MTTLDPNLVTRFDFKCPKNRPLSYSRSVFGDPMVCSPFVSNISASTNGLRSFSGSIATDPASPAACSGTSTATGIIRCKGAQVHVSRPHPTPFRWCASANSSSHTIRTAGSSHRAGLYFQLMNPQLAGCVTARVPNR